MLMGTTVLGVRGSPLFPNAHGVAIALRAAAQREESVSHGVLTLSAVAIALGLSGAELAPDSDDV